MQRRKIRFAGLLPEVHGAEAQAADFNPGAT